MKTKIAVLSAPPEITVEDKFFNKACCYLPDFGITDYIHLPEKGLSAMTCYEADISFISSPKKLAVKIDSISSQTATPVSIVIGKKS
jgi:hypothetical protein